MNLSYQKLLADSIEKSGFSMRKISRICSERGLPISQSYLSQLSRGEVPPASDKINVFLGEVFSELIGIEQDVFLIEAYREKIPPEVLKRLQKANTA
ncbi:hypothetical protein [Aneurinibacillus aneurinilyticus]|uniref:hypothetical protein n=1 Tax=Aneurinibacillus aneurinilyticus TaxID=1391 RepID=UPI0023EFFC97|nr:hypothetical protein [Aneurinibacillus aneurinilyticus]